MNNRKIKAAFVTPRCGKEVNGGAEYLCFLIAKLMSDIWDVEVITTCALDYVTWNNFYPEGVELIDDVKIRRFKNDYLRNSEEFNKYSGYIISKGINKTLEECEIWMKKQGPYSSDLLSYLEDNKNNFDLFFFIPYLYSTTYHGLPLVFEKSVLIPAAHDEWPIYLPIWDEWIKKANFHIYSTIEEKLFIEKRFPGNKFQGEIIGVGSDFTDDCDKDSFIKKYSIDYPFIIYIGRIDESKGCGILFDYFIKFKENNPSDLKLLLLGKPVMEIPKHKDIVSLGFVDNQTKYDAIAASEFLVNPSEFESLSMVLLETWYLNKPTLVNGKCEVMVGQSQRSNGGLWYNDYDEFEECAKYLINHKNIANNAKEYVTENYSWDIIKEKYIKVADNLLKE